MPRLPALAPFQVRSFRFQWPADLLTSWAFEMETLILGWYVLVETGSVLWLTVFGALGYGGTLLAPMLGVASDRIGHRTVLCAMRAIYAAVAAALMVLAFAGALTPLVVCALAALTGLVRPSDLGLRGALIAETMPMDRLTAAMGISRTTSDSARVAGALVGAGLFAAFGIAAAYVAITGFYLLGALLTLGVARAGARQPAPAAAAGLAVSTSIQSLARSAGRDRACLEYAAPAGRRVARIPVQSDRVPDHERPAALCRAGRLSHRPDRPRISGRELRVRSLARLDRGQPVRRRDRPAAPDAGRGRGVVRRCS